MTETSTHHEHQVQKPGLRTKLRELFVGITNPNSFDWILRLKISRLGASETSLDASLQYARWAESTFFEYRPTNDSFPKNTEKVAHKITQGELVKIIRLFEDNPNIHELTDELSTFIEVTNGKFDNWLDLIGAFSKTDGISEKLRALAFIQSELVKPIPSHNLHTDASGKVHLIQYPNGERRDTSDPLSNLLNLDEATFNSIVSPESVKRYRELEALLREKARRYSAGSLVPSISVTMLPDLFQLLTNESLSKLLFSQLQDATTGDIDQTKFEHLIRCVERINEKIPELVKVSDAGFNISEFLPRISAIPFDDSGENVTEQLSSWLIKVDRALPGLATVRAISENSALLQNVHALTAAGMTIFPGREIGSRESTPFYESQPLEEIEKVAAFVAEGYESLGFDVENDRLLGQLDQIQATYADLISVLNPYSVEEIRSRLKLLPANLYELVFKSTIADFDRKDSLTLLRKVMSFSDEVKLSGWLLEVSDDFTQNALAEREWQSKELTPVLREETTLSMAKGYHVLSADSPIHAADEIDALNQDHEQFQVVVSMLAARGAHIRISELSTVLTLNQLPSEELQRFLTFVDAYSTSPTRPNRFVLGDQLIQVLSEVASHSELEIQNALEVLSFISGSATNAIEYFFEIDRAVDREHIQYFLSNSTVMRAGIEQIARRNIPLDTSNRRDLLSPMNTTALAQSLIAIADQPEILNMFELLRGMRDQKLDLLDPETTNGLELLQNKPYLLEIAELLKKNAKLYYYKPSDIPKIEKLYRHTNAYKAAILLGNKSDYILSPAEIDILCDYFDKDDTLAQFIAESKSILTDFHFQINDLKFFAQVKNRSDILQFLRAVVAQNEAKFSAFDLPRIESAATNPELTRFVSEMVNRGLSFNSYALEAYKNLSSSEDQVLAFLDADPQNASVLSHNILHFTQQVPENLEAFIEMVKEIEFSQSQDIRTLREQLIDQLMKHPNPQAAWRAIEATFIKNHSPLVVKIFEIFQIIHPDDLINDLLLVAHQSSPILRAASPRRRRFVIYRDLINIHLRTGNRSLREFLELFSEVRPLCLKIESEGFGSLTSGEAEAINSFVTRADLLTQKARASSPFPRNNVAVDQSEINLETVEDKYNALKKSMAADTSTELSQIIDDILLRPVGLSSVETALAIANKARIEADQRGRHLFALAQQNENLVDLRVGDLLKAVNSDYFANFVQNGSVSQEFLGPTNRSDLTPLDIDLTMLLSDSRVDPNATTPLSKYLNYSASRPGTGYGDVTFVIRDRGQFDRTDLQTTAAKPPKIGETNYRPELFKTGATGEDHFGIRTGLPFSEIDFVIIGDSVTPERLDAIKLEIVKGRQYTPLVDTLGKIIFTPNDFDKLAEVFSGIHLLSDVAPTVSDFSQNNERLKEQLNEIVAYLDTNEEQVEQKHSQIVSAIEKVLAEQQVSILDQNSDSTLGAEIDNIGSTSRLTNARGPGDFDFAVFLDAYDFNHVKKITESLREVFQAEKFEVLGDHDYWLVRIKGIQNEGLEEAEVDIGFMQKSSERSFASHDSVKAKLESIRQTYGETTYKQSIAQVILAKEVLKQAEAYGKVNGYLSGIAVENLILQNQSNLVAAFSAFVSAAESATTVAEFAKVFPLWNPGMNARELSHTNFSSELSEVGLKKTAEVMKRFLRSLDQQ